ncbi:hypothetical protein KPL71_022286 [Citrus sinensis]|uniref:Uncharacterized protein n=2 Tax=Citrus sinensis TaxID=2711 RepID=A0ACB8JP47_CITSI|nr:hypothetical protein KPL71_022285 [Citrus sinensis]KAH9718601.1 hypothetical protein KPL71_022286 [Citrus sinensis]
MITMKNMKRKLEAFQLTNLRTRSLITIIIVIKIKAGAATTTTIHQKDLRMVTQIASEPLMPSHNSSVLLQLISCGNLAVAKAKSMPSFKQPFAAVNNSDKNKNEVVVKKRGINDNLHKGVLCKNAIKIAEKEDNTIINYMSENPRFGKFQSQEKEYFSGSNC